jgi:glycosyltransferase involved in cell wall biosynthesis
MSRLSRSPTFSVVIPTYNRLDSLKRAVNSVWLQTYGGYEIIVVDDGSSDGTTDHIASLNGRVKALHQRNSGPAAARNLGVAHATGEYVAFLDSDDLWPPWTLATYKSLVQINEPSLLNAAVVEFRDVVPVLKEGPLHAEYFRDFLDTARQPGFVGSGALVIKRSEFERASGFDERLTVAEDHDFYFRAGSAPGFVRVLSPVTLMYRRHDDSTAKLLPAACAGAIAILTREAEGLYPGGNERQAQRWQLLSRMLRPIALSGVRAGLGLQPWRLYCRSFRINVRLGRFRFLVGFVLYGLLSLLWTRRPQEGRVG